MKLTKTVKKLGLFVGAWIIIIMLIKNTWNAPFQILVEAKASSESLQDTAYFFLGSSRVQCGINPDIIKKKFGKNKVYNLAVGGATFLNSCIIAQHLIQTKGNKVVFIELANIHQKLPEHIFTMTQVFDINLPNALHQLIKEFDVKRQLAIQTHYLEQAAFFVASVKNNTQRLLNYRHQKSPIGFQSYTQNLYPNTSSYITIDEVLSPPSSQPYLKEQKLLIDYLTSLAQQKQTKIVFLLPINMSDGAKKHQILGAYHYISPQQKIVYNADFLKKIRQAHFLKDALHLNQWGAQKYTELLCPLIKSYF